MKHTKKIKPKVTPILIFCGCILFCALSFCVGGDSGSGGKCDGGIRRNCD